MHNKIYISCKSYQQHLFLLIITICIVKMLKALGNILRKH